MARLEKFFIFAVSFLGIVQTFFLRPRVIMYGNDRVSALPYEPRMAKVYQWLESCRIPYVHLIHTVPHGHVMRHWWQRRQPVVYLEALEFFSGVLRLFISSSGARQLWGIDDFRHWPRIVSAARKAGIQSVLFQHGRFNQYKIDVQFPGPLYLGELPDLYITWNSYWHDKLLSLSSAFAHYPERIRIGGKPSEDQKIDYRHTREDSLRVMLVHEPVAVSGEIQAIVDQLTLIPDIKRIYKVRKDQSNDTQIDHHGLRSHLSNGWTVVNDIPEVDLILGSYSTLLYEMIQAQIPIGVLKISSTQADDLIEAGLASEIIPNRNDLGEQLKKASTVTSAELERRANVFATNHKIEDTLKALIL
jgi:hypothetical protein